MRKNVLVVVSILFMATRVFAGLTVSPARQEISLAPGVTHGGTYTVRNDYAVPAQINAEFRDWFVLPENRNISIADWLDVSPREFILKPGESRDVGYTVRLSTAVQGVSVAMVSFIPEVESEQGVTMVVSVSLFVTAAGTENVSWGIGDVTFGASPGLNISAAIHNNGNVHLRPLGDVRIFSGDQAVFSSNFAEGRPVYPGSSRSLTASSDAATPLPAGKYTAVIRVSAAGQEKIKQMNITVNKSGEITLR